MAGYYIRMPTIRATTLGQSHNNKYYKNKTMGKENTTKRNKKVLKKKNIVLLSKYTRRLYNSFKRGKANILA